MGKELFFSVISVEENVLYDALNEAQINEALRRDTPSNLPAKRIGVFYLWALWDIYPSFDVHRPPSLSGIGNPADIIDIAKQNGLDSNINFDPEYDCNVRLKEIAEYDFQLVSYQKRQTGLYFFCVWGNHFQYLCGLEPIFQQDNITEDELKTLKTTWGDSDCAGSGYGGYIKEYIRKREAQRKLSTPKNSNAAIFIEFLYSPKNTWHIPRKRWVWQRHRIVKKTKDFIYIEEFPYYGGRYLKTGWQAFIVYTIMINRKELEGTHQFNHHSRRKIFYEKCAVPELKTYHFNTSIHDQEADYDDFVIEVPLNDVQWALNLLNIDEWPTTIEVIKRAYKVLCMKTHPDRDGGSHDAQLECKKARNTLLDLAKK